MVRDYYEKQNEERAAKNLPPLRIRRAEMERIFAERGADDFFKEAVPFLGFRVARRLETGPDDVVLDLEIGPQKPWKLTCRREEGAWTLRF